VLFEAPLVPRPASKSSPPSLPPSNGNATDTSAAIDQKAEDTPMTSGPARLGISTDTADERRSVKDRASMLLLGGR